MNVSPQTDNARRLIEENQGLVRSLALKIHSKLPPHVDLDDLIAYGQVGLAEAARDFEPARGGRFSTYAYYRTRGAIYDGLSKMNWFSRAQYKRVRYEQMANEVLQVDSAAPEAADKNRSDGELGWFRDISCALAVVCLATRSDDTGQSTLSSVEDPTSPDPTKTAISRETTRRLRELIDGLPSEAGKLIRATYYEGATLQEAGKRLGISKSWASRLHAKTLRHLAHSLRVIETVSW